MTKRHDRKHVAIYTDGACLGNPGPGGWGAVLRYGDKEKEISGANPETTNNRMEMTAAIEALRLLKTPCAVDLYTDSKYLLQGATQWLSGWRDRGWRTADKKPVKNLDLWQELETELKRHNVIWHWIKGHSGHQENERADQLATSAIRQHFRN